jgi:hypothetical protein
MQANPTATAGNPSGESGVETGFNPLALLLNDWQPKPAGADVAIARLLLQHAAKVPGRRGKLLNERTSITAHTPLHLAVAVSLHKARVAQKQAVVELLLAQPETDVNAVDALGAPPSVFCDAAWKPVSIARDQRARGPSCPLKIWKLLKSVTSAPTGLGCVTSAMHVTKETCRAT